MVVYEINGDDMDAAQDKFDALDKAAKKLGIKPGLVDNSGHPRLEDRA